MLHVPSGLVHSLPGLVNSLCIPPDNLYQHACPGALLLWVPLSGVIDDAAA